LAGIRTPPPNGSRKSNHKLEPRHHKLSTHGWNSKPFNFLKIYFDLPDNMTNTLMNDFSDAKIIDLVSPASQLYKLHCLKTKLKNCLTTDLTHDIEASMPTGLINKDG
jgi:hypothetical protein